jgi:hypothetical protein
VQYVDGDKNREIMNEKFLHRMSLKEMFSHEWSWATKHPEMNPVAMEKYFAIDNVVPKARQISQSRVKGRKSP